MSEKNYHSRLLDISKNWDHVIEKLKTSYSDIHNQPNWITWWLSSPIREIKDSLKYREGIQKVLSSEFMTVILPMGIGGFLGYQIPTEMPTIVPILGGVAAGILLNLFINFFKLVKFNSKHFHLGAYATFRKQEYDILKASFLDQEGEFYFQGIYDYITSKKSGYESIEKLLMTYIQTEKTGYESKIHHLEEKIKHNQLEYDEKTQELNERSEELTEQLYGFIDELIEQQESMDAEFEHVIELIKDINTLLFRMHNKGISTKDLNILTGFTLYELKGNNLVQLDDVNTSGVSPLEIDITNPKFQHYGAVTVLNDDSDTPHLNEPYSGHMVVSYKMNIDQKSTWIYNFHFEKSNSKAWQLLVENATLESREIYRLIHALCLLTLDFEGKEEKGAVNQ